MSDTLKPKRKRCARAIFSTRKKVNNIKYVVKEDENSRIIYFNLNLCQ
jgi:hypothetical protein